MNCLYVLRKAPCGPYVLMMSRILLSFLSVRPPRVGVFNTLQTTIIWIPTLLCFAFCFQLVMRDSGTQPRDDPEISAANRSSIILAMFQSFTKTSAMVCALGIIARARGENLKRRGAT